MTRSLELEAENEPFVKNGVAANLPSAKKSKFIVVVMFSLLALLALIHSSSETDTATTAIVESSVIIKEPLSPPPSPPPSIKFPVPIDPQPTDSTPLTDLFMGITNPPYSQTKANLIAHIRQNILTPATFTSCAAERESWLSSVNFHAFSPNSIPDMGSKHGVAYCRGKSALHSRLNIYTASSFVTPKNEFSTELVNHVILFPCPQAEPQEPPSALSLATDPTDEFHSLSFYSSLVGPAMITPVIQTLTVDDTPIWLLSFRVPVPGSYTLKVAIRYFNDFNQRRYIFFGESEARPTRCPSESCGHRTQGKSPDGKPLDCNVESSVLTTDVVVTGPSPSQSLIGAKTLPLAENSDRSPDAAWIKIAENAADCTARLDEINSIFSGNPCRIGGSSLGENHPIYAYQPSDKRYHFYTSGEIASCFEERNINSILIQGDSQARAVYSTLPMLLGDLDMGPDYAQELKEKLKKNDDVGGDTVENLGRGKIKVVYKQEWDENFALVDAMFDSAGLFKVGGPEVFIYNAGAPAHKGLDPTLFAQWWNDKISDPENVPPKVCVFILPVTIQGQRNYFWAKSSTAVNSEKMEIMFKQMGFAVLFLDQLTIGWPIATTGEEDGFHYGFNAMAMASMITINLICNNEAFEFNEGKFFEVGQKLEFDKSKKAGRMYSYEFVEYKNKFGNDMTVAVPHPAISEQFEEEGKHVNPCNCFDVQLIPYNLVDVFTFSLWNE